MAPDVYPIVDEIMATFIYIEQTERARRKNIAVAGSGAGGGGGGC
jgi:NADH dehydrogenase FAD-containing subunit